MCTDLINKILPTHEMIHFSTFTSIIMKYMYKMCALFFVDKVSAHWFRFCNDDYIHGSSYFTRTMSNVSLPGKAKNKNTVKPLHLSPTRRRSRRGETKPLC